MTPQQFLAKWKAVELSERSACQSHFLDLCRVLGQPAPTDADPTGEWYTFEKGVRKDAGGQGFADVWRRGFFAWEYKKKRRSLAAAYQQLTQYREALANPPLLVVCDLNKFEVHTNFTGTIKEVRAFDLDGLADPKNLDVLRAAFTDPDRLKPGRTQKQVTEEVASRFKDLADGLRNRGIEPHRAGHFLMQLMFCMFAEDIELLPTELFVRTVANSKRDPAKLTKFLRSLFACMATGEAFGADEIARFNGKLFESADVFDLEPAEIELLHQAALCNWSGVEPSIFGTMFERILDPDKRGQLGAHYTGREDIETLLRPVLLDPLRREWAETHAEAEKLWAAVAAAAKEAAGATKNKEDRKLVTRARKARERFDAKVIGFLDRLAGTTVLDPACGSGNFLYVALRMLLDMEKELLVYAGARNITRLPQVRPTQLHGIEVNPYARELAQVVIWIGFLQWMKFNGFITPSDPVLLPMDCIENRDAVLDLSDPADPKEPAWPAAEFVVGNPPFLGGKMLRSNLGDGYVDALFKVWGKRVRPEADLCVYWFEKARAMIEAGGVKRAGLLATQAVRGGANRDTLAKIKETGDIFYAVSDRDWVLDGANVHISMVGFDDGSETSRVLDGVAVATINANLTAAADVTQAKPLPANLGVGFMGDTKGGPFDIPFETAKRFLLTPNVNGRPSSDVITPWCNGKDVTQRGRDMWIIDFGTAMIEDEAAQYEGPFEYVRKHVYPERQGNKRDSYRLKWWLHVEARSGMRRAFEPLPRFVGIPRVAKHLVYVWIAAPTMPDCQLITFANADDYFMGVLHSRYHELWARSQGTQPREVESGFRYTPTTCFETFPFPEPTAAQRAEVAAAAAELDRLRANWLNPPNWTRTETLEFPGSAAGPWRRYVSGPDARGVGTVRYPRLVPADAAAGVELKKRMLTALYNKLQNGEATWLANAHRRLDAAVAAAYGWPPDRPDAAVLADLLALNLARSGHSGT